MKKRKIFNESYQPIWLPQMTAEYDYILKNLDDEGVKYSFVMKTPTDLKPLQSTVDTGTVDYFTNKINNGQEIQPPFISENDEILDGHNRNHAFKNHPRISNVYCIKLHGMDYLDSARILNKIQDRYSWEQTLETPTNTVSGAEGMETINPDVNTDNNSNGNISDVDETTNNKVDKKALKLFRVKPIKENSKTGNFFVLEHKPRHDHEFDVEFDNLFEMNDQDIKDNDPITSLAEMWFGNLKQVQEDATKRVLDFNGYICEKISEEAKKRGFDGIKYGTKFLQTVSK